MRILLLLSAILLTCSTIVVGQSLSSPESIVWDHVNNRYLVSNSGDGLLRSIDADGESSFYGLEARASHGLVIVGDKLYACYRSTVRSFDLASETLEDVYTISGAKFLNGICADQEGNLYITDFTTKTIYRIKLNEAGSMQRSERWKSLDRIPNGISLGPNDEELIVLTWGRDAEIICINKQTASITDRIESGYDNLEGITVNDQGVYISSWGPSAILHYPQGVRGESEILEIKEEKPTGLLLDDNGHLIHLSTDAESVGGLHKTSMDSWNRFFEISVFPNPISVNSLISYEVKEEGAIYISVYDCRGNLVERLFEGQQVAGQHQLIYDKGDRPSGLYFVHIQSESGSEAKGLTFVD